MAILVGFKRAYFSIPATADNAEPEVIVVEGKENQGATSTAKITGLSKEATKVPGSDVDYYISRQGVGNVAAELALLDLPHDAENKLLGKTVDETTKIAYAGNKTEPPYIGVVLESSDAQGNKAEFAFFKGTLAKDEIDLNTLDPSNTFTPAAETYTLTVIASDAEGKQNGQYVGELYGDATEDAEGFSALETQALGKAVSAADVGTSDPKA